MKIFIQIASYRDPELLFTIKDCINNANKPNNLVFAIANQYHPDDKSYDLSEYENDKRFKILNIPYQDWDDEYTIQKTINKLKFYAVVTNNVNGYVTHIGWNDHIYESNDIKYRKDFPGK